MAYVSLETPAAGHPAAGKKTKIIRLRASYDDGDNWTDNIKKTGATATDVFGEVFQRAMGPDDIEDPTCLQIPNTGTIFCVFRNFSFNNGVVTKFRITLAQSTDFGKTFPEANAKNILEWNPAPDNTKGDPLDKRNGLYQPQIKRYDDGYLQVYWAEETSTTDQNIVIHESTDGGLTWRYLTTAVGADETNLRDDWPAVVTTGGDRNV